MTSTKSTDETVDITFDRELAQELANILYHEYNVAGERHRTEEVMKMAADEIDAQL